MIDEKYQNYLYSWRWYQLRDKILKRDPICRRCRKRKSQVVHHLTYKNIYHESEAELIGVCWRCHKILHKGLFRLVLEYLIILFILLFIFSFLYK